MLHIVKICYYIEVNWACVCELASLCVIDCVPLSHIVYLYYVRFLQFV